MRLHRRMSAALLPAALALGLAAAGAAHALTVYDALDEVPDGNPRQGIQTTDVAPRYFLSRVATGSDPLENPAGTITHFGYLNDFPPQTVEPTKTEPDENLYLIFDKNPGGPTPG